MTSNQLYSHLQSLIQITNFIKTIQQTTLEQRIALNQINQQIQNFNKSQTLKEWEIYLGIFDTTCKSGLFCRSWSIKFNNQKLEIQVGSKHTEYPLTEYPNHSSFFAFVYFPLDVQHPHENFLINFNSLITDITNYQTYITNTMNEIDIDISIQ